MFCYFCLHIGLLIDDPFPPPSKLPSKWKADNSSVSSLCISPDGKMLLSAGRSIKLWDLETKEVYRVRNICLFFAVKMGSKITEV